MLWVDILLVPNNFVFCYLYFLGKPKCLKKNLKVCATFGMFDF